MTKSFIKPALVMTITASAAQFAHAAPQNPLVVGKARFTVLTPNCVRLEYSENGKFVDAASLFAVNRDTRFSGFKVSKSGQATTIDTGKLSLTYTDDGTPFSARNLTGTVRGDADFTSKKWTPASKNSGNLGGTLRTLDGVTGPVGIGQGVLSRDGWYLLDDSKAPLLKGDWVAARPTDAGTDWYFFGYGNDYRTALKTLTAVGGAVPLPRRNVLGTWYSRYWAYSSDDFRQLVKEYHEHNFPLDNMVLDMDWHRDGWTGWSWNKKLLPDAPKLLADLHAAGLQTTLNLHPADGVGAHEDRYKEFMAAAGVPADGKTLPYDTADQKQMKALQTEVMAPLKKDGVDFWWPDWQQYSQTRSIPSLTNLWWLNEFLFRDTSQDGRRGVSFSRWAGWGDHRHPIHFSGDASTNFEMLAFEVPFTAAAGNVGCFFWSHDIGGHQGGRNEESYARWCQFGAFTAALRSHSTRDATTDRRPWNYAKWAEDSMRTSFHLRSEMFPYIYSSTAQSVHDSVPLTRPLYIDYPQDEASYHNGQEYLFGDNLLVAPVVSAGIGAGRVSHQSVYFPRGTWFNTFSNERFAGGTEVLCAATIDEFPLFARGGVPIPMQPYTERMTSTPLSTLRVRVYPGSEGQTGKAQLYEDDGDSNAYKNSASATTQLSYSRKGDDITVTVGATKGQFKGQVANRALKIELPATMRATSATLGAEKLPIAYDDATATNIISVPARPIGKATTIKVTVADADFEMLSQKAQAKRMTALTGRDFAPQSPRDLLKTAMSGDMDGDEMKEALAVVGVGVVRKNLSPTFTNGEVRDIVYAPEGVLDDTPFVSTVSQSRATLKFDGQVLRLPNGLLGNNNIAAAARVKVSGIEPGYGQSGANDGEVSGYPNNSRAEWASGQKENTSIRLDWDTPQTIDRIALFDRINVNDNILKGILTFSDGTTVDVGALPNDGETPFLAKFPAKTVNWVEFKVLAVSSTTEGSGLAEISVFRAKQ
jgi:alpha-glucosidase (family GH31 glycosyl hydrolase)